MLGSRAAGNSIRNFSSIGVRRQEATFGVLRLGKEQTTRSTKKLEKVVNYKIHCKFAKNNTLLTLTSTVEDMNFQQNNPQLPFNEKVLYYVKLPERTLHTVTTGNLGFRKWQRGEYELAHRASTRLFEIMESKNYLNRNIELVLQDFGKGRKLFEDALLGKPGNKVRDLITRITDVTKIKFGGVRSPKVRRL